MEDGTVSDDSPREPRPEAWTSKLVIELVRSLPVGSETNDLLADVRHFGTLPPAEQEACLVEMALYLEERILSQPKTQLDRDVLRAEIYQPFSQYLSDPRFVRLITPRQRVQLGILFLQHLVEHALNESAALMGGLLATHAWLESAPDNTCPPVPLGVADELPADDRGWSDVLTLLTERVFEYLRSSLSEGKVRELVRGALDLVASQHGGPDACIPVRDMVPVWALGAHLEEEKRAGEAPKHALGKIALVRVGRPGGSPTDT